MLTNVLSGEVDIALDNSLRFEHAQVLRREWSATKKGVVLFEPIQPRTGNFQRRPELADPQALLDVRVRRALAHAVDKQGIIDGLFEGEAIPLADQLLPPTMPYFADLDRAAVKYPYDLRAAEQRMSEAGYRLTPERGYIDATGERIAFTLMSGGGSQNEKERAVVADGWRRAGFDVSESSMPPALATDPQHRATWPSVHTSAANLGEAALRRYTSGQICTAAYRWRGEYAGGWSNADYDSLYQQFNSTLERSERDHQVAGMMRALTDDVGALFFFHNPSITVHTTALTGPVVGTPDQLLGWNVYEWVLH
jgi:peptide/nickel transport system substrate-binding protein